MGTKYSTISVSGYNASPPADDGSQVSSNQVKWSYIKGKIGDPLNTFASAVDSALVTALNFGVRQVTASGNTTAADHMKTVEVAPSVSTAVTISLGDAATMTANYIVRVKNSGSSTVTVSRVTGADTMDGVAQDLTLLAGQVGLYGINQAADGYLSLGGGNAVAASGSFVVKGTSSSANLYVDAFTGASAHVIFKNNGTEQSRITNLNAENTIGFYTSSSTTLQVKVNHVASADRYIAFSGGTAAIEPKITTSGGQLNLTSSTGVIGLPTGQLQFPAAQNASSDANTLDDYEEGSTTPTPTPETGSFTSASSSIAYVKVGKQVTISLSVTITDAGTGAGQIQVTMPFTCAAKTCGSGFGNAIGGLQCWGFLDASSATLKIKRYDNSTMIQSGQTLEFGITYIATA